MHSLFKMYRQRQKKLRQHSNSSSKADITQNIFQLPFMNYISGSNIPSTIWSILPLFFYQPLKAWK